MNFISRTSTAALLFFISEIDVFCNGFAMAPAPSQTVKTPTTRPTTTSAPSFSSSCVPTITNTANTTVNVPCGYNGTLISHAMLNISAISAATCGSYTLNQVVVYSLENDYSAGYVVLLPDGSFVRGLTGPTKNVTQVIAFSLRQKNLYSNTVIIKFVQQSCVLQIACPPSISYCPTIADASLAGSMPYPQFTCQVTTKVPTGTIISWDRPGHYGATLDQLTIGLGADAAGARCTTSLGVLNATVVSCLPSPSIINSTAGVNPADAVGIYISNYNTHQVLGLDPTSTTGVYGRSQNDLLNLGADQSLLVSATAPEPFVTGSAVVKTTVICSLT